jgi:small-conductance mechanosensitive channel
MQLFKRLKVMKEEHGLMQLFKRIGYFVLVIVGQFLLFWGTNWLFRKLKLRIMRLEKTRLKPFSIQGYELLDTRKQVKLLIFLANLVRYAFMFLQLLLTVPLLFSIFPQTKNLAYRLLSYIWNPVKSILTGILDYLPNLFTIFVIYMAIKYLVRFFRYLAEEVQSERLKLSGFYPDWAMPTYHIVRFLLYAFMIAMIYPYLPGSNSGVFQGISVFVGLIVSLGSSTVIGNIIAGLVITYMRPFKIGDRIKLNDTMGNVVEKTPLVTRIRTPKNEVVTIPNSFVIETCEVLTDSLSITQRLIEVILGVAAVPCIIFVRGSQYLHACHEIKLVLSVQLILVFGKEIIEHIKGMGCCDTCAVLCFSIQVEKWCNIVEVHTGDIQKPMVFTMIQTKM